MKLKLFSHTLLLALIVSFAGCSGDGGINIFSIEDDKELGAQVDAQIESDPQFKILSRTSYANSYAYLENMKNIILNSGELNHADDFLWELHIIDNDSVLNAFATPGGYIYFYTGLIKYLDDASSLAGVLGHEMAHSDRRHSTDQLTQAYGIQVLLDVVLGNNQGLLTDIAASLLTLKFSRNAEAEADEFSVKYLCDTKFRGNGAAGFFEKIVQSGGSGTPEFISTHPDPGNRVTDINAKSQELNCPATISQQEEITDYQGFKNSLP